jgi:hypothetical protein
VARYRGPVTLFNNVVNLLSNSLLTIGLRGEFSRSRARFGFLYASETLIVR